MLAAVAAGYIVAAAGSGFLGDRLGSAAVIAAASVVYGLGLVLGGFGNEWQARYLPVIFVVAIAGGRRDDARLGPPLQADAAGRPRRHLGAGDDDEGIGLLTGPLLAGAAIDLLSPYLEDTDGYQALWPILGIPVLVIPLCRPPLSGRAEGRNGTARKPRADHLGRRTVVVRRPRST